VAITSSDLLVKLSTQSGSAGNSTASTPAASLGGYMSSTQVTAATLNNLFDDVSGAENAANDVEYRCLFFHNNHGSLSLTNARVYVQGQTAGGANAAIALDTIGVTAANSGSLQADTVADESTAPSPALTYTTPADYANGLVVGTVANGQCFAVWVRRTAANSAAIDPDGIVIRLEGDTLP
jgi:hypothetical protein